MSPESYRKRLCRLFEDMQDLYAAGNNDSMLLTSLRHVHQAYGVLKNQPTVFKSGGCKFVRGHRNHVQNTVQILKRARRPMTLTRILSRIREQNPALLDLQYRTFHPTIRQEVRRSNARLAECGSADGHKLYGLTHWKAARPCV